ncbi:MAG: GyrI-like domain-containing protein [Planctomycetia bacterium]|nr:GyrI-like domain-containing protein [Planctomycetia bacterium]
MIDPPQIIEIAAQQAAVIHMTVPREEIRTVMGLAVQEVAAAATAQGIGPAGPLFSHHARVDPVTFDFEVGVPVTRLVTPTGRVKPGELPAAKVARTVYHGPYEGLGAAWSAFSEWIEQSGHKPAPNLWERYLAGPESSLDPSQWRTELNRPLVS